MANVKNTKECAQQPIRVFLRIRPLQDHEKRTPGIEVLNSKEVQVNRTFQKKYLFDGVFGQDSNQSVLYKTVAKSLISDILTGYTCTVFAFGQTGTGKTFTISGTLPECQSPVVLLNPDNVVNTVNFNQSNNLNENTGLIPRFVSELFEHVRLLNEQYTVRCSYLELYNEELRDLFSINDNSNRIRIYENYRNKSDITIHGLSELTVYNATDVFKLLKKAQDKRCSAATLVNDQSSRSHTLFSITVHTREANPTGEQMIKMGKINFVDLAGSENINKSGGGDRRVKEAATINQSLLTLGRVIKALSEKNLHAPFRESKLTRLLRDSLGGKTKTTIIATVSPSLSSLEETMSTLDYASKSRTIANRPEINRRTSQTTLMNQYIDEISYLRRDLEAARSGQGIILNIDNYNKIMADQQANNEQLSKMTVSINELGKQLRLVEERKENCQAEWGALNQSFLDTQNQLEQTKRWWGEIELEKRKHEYVASTYEKTAENLYKNAEHLLKMVKLSSYNQSTLQEKVTYLYHHTNDNNTIIKNTSLRVQTMCNELFKEFTDYRNSHESFMNNMTNMIHSYHKYQTILFSTLSNHVCCIQDVLENEKKLISRSIENSCSTLQNIRQQQLNQFSDFCKGVKHWQEWQKSQFESHTDTLKQELYNYADHTENLKSCTLKLKSLLPLGKFCIDIKTLQSETSQQLEQLLLPLSHNETFNDISISESIGKQEIVIQTINSNLDSLENLLDQSKEQSVSTSILAENFQNKFTNEMEAFQQNYETRSNQILDISTDLMDLIDKNSSNNLIVAINQYTEQRTENDIVAADQLTQLSNKIKNSTDEFLNDNFTVLKELQNLLNTKLRSVAENVGKRKIEIHSDGLDTAIFKSMDEQFRESSQHTTSLTHKVNEVKSLMTCSFRGVNEVKPTGNTPLRDSYEHTSQLKDLTPKDRILSRFHNIKLGDRAETTKSQSLATRLFYEENGST